MQGPRPSRVGVETGTRMEAAVRTGINLLAVVAGAPEEPAGTAIKTSPGPAKMETGRVQAVRMVLNSNNYAILCSPIHYVPSISASERRPGKPLPQISVGLIQRVLSACNESPTCWKRPKRS